MNNVTVSEENESGLILRFMKGDKEAFGKIYDLYAPTLLGIIKKIIHNDKEAEEILQHVFVDLWRNKNTFDSKNEKFFKWMFKITRQIAIKKLDHLNNTKKINTYGNQALTSNEIPHASLDLIFYHGYSFSDAASQLEITLDHLTSNIKMSLDQLKISVSS